MTASAWWIGVESMTAAALTAAAAHPRPIFCGRLSVERSVQAVLADAGKRVEAHEVALHTAIGQGYLLDLMRQRMPIEHITLALPAISTGNTKTAYTPPFSIPFRCAVKMLKKFRRLSSVMPSCLPTV